jgi:hypothetical protein
MFIIFILPKAIETFGRNRAKDINKLTSHNLDLPLPLFPKNTSFAVIIIFCNLLSYTIYIDNNVSEFI